jgi:hypothetical protein
MKLAYINGLAPRERLQGIRQLSRLRHNRPVDQNWDNANVAGKRSCDFNSNEIIRLMEAAISGFVRRIQPVGTDDDQKDFARSNLAVQMRREVDPGRNVVDIHEDIFLSELMAQPVVQPTGSAYRILSSIVNENSVRHSVSHVADPRSNLTHE